MIILENKYDCCGCHACVTICPRKCISMHPDQEGFLYPSTDQNLCVDCHLCENVCPMISQKEERKNAAEEADREPIKAYAARSGDSLTAQNSASGGIFPILAEKVLNEGGVVFGARWDEDFMGVRHDFITDKKDLYLFQGSKYVQSTIGNAFFQVRDFLKSNRKVLFSGTPCQIQGLKKVIRKNSELLITVDIACHSVPSPKVWKSFFRNLIAKNRISDVSGVFMRKKTFSPARGWRCDSFVVWWNQPTPHPLKIPFMKPPTDAVFWKACFPARHVKNALPKIWKAAAISRLEIFGEWKTIFRIWSCKRGFPSLSARRPGLTHCWNLCAALCPFYVLPNINGRQRIMRDYVLIPGKTLIGTPFSGSWPNAVPIRRRSI